MTDDFAISDEDTRKLQNILESYLSDSPTSRMHKLDSEFGCIEEGHTETMEDICYFAALDIAGSGTVTELKDFFENEGEIMLAGDCEDIISSYVNSNVNEDVSDVEEEEIDQSIPQKTFPKQTTDEIPVLISLLDKRLRPILNETPKNEHDVHKAVKQLFTGTQFDERYNYENVTVIYSAKHYIPDFVFKDMNTVVEIKFCDSKDDVKKFIGQINDDIMAYKKDYSNIIFVVYDLSFINDEENFKRDLENAPGVTILIVKH